MPSDDQTRLPEDSNRSSLLTDGQSFGQYNVVRLLGRGGMGEVYEVENSILGKRYALKLVNREIMQRPEAVERFKREAMVMSGFDHPNIVKVDDFGEIDGHAVLRMELVGCVAANESEKCGVESGEFNSLDDLLTGEPLAEELVVDLLQQILSGLSYAHEQGVVHRDLKPSNILLQSNPLAPNTYIPKITDFGLVRLAGEQWLQSQVQLTVARSMTSDSTRLEGSSGSAGTSAQALLGTFEFMSPEQKKGQDATAQSDLYAIGLIAFRMLTGHESPGMEIASQIVPGLNPAWDVWLIKALKQAAGDRYANAAEMLEAMPESGQRATIVSAPKSSGKGVWPAVAALLLVMLGAGGCYFGIYQPEQERIAEEARQVEIERQQAEESALLAAEAVARKATEEEQARLGMEARRLREEANNTEKARIAWLARPEAEREKAEEEEIIGKFDPDKSVELEAKPNLEKDELSRISKFLKDVHIGGVRTGDRPKLILNGISYNQGDVVNAEFGLRFIGLRDKKLAFRSSEGIVYIKSF